MRTLERERRFASVLFQSASNGYFYFRVLPNNPAMVFTNFFCWSGIWAAVGGQRYGHASGTTPDSAGQIEE